MARDGGAEARLGNGQEMRSSAKLAAEYRCAMFKKRNYKIVRLFCLKLYKIQRIMILIAFLLLFPVGTRPY